MPGVIGPTNEQLQQQLAQMRQELTALRTQQQAMITNALGQAVVNIGLVPGSNPARYGIQFVDPATGSEIAFLGVNSTGQALSLTMTGNNSAITVKDASNGGTTGIIGALPSSYNRSDGSAQPGMILYREDGTTAVVLGDLSPTVAPYKQAYQVFDRSGHDIMSDDTNGGVGLARPYLPLGQFVSIGSGNMATTTSATFTDIQWCVSARQHPKAYFSLIAYSSDSATTGALQVVDQNGNVLASTTVSGSQFSQVALGPVAWPAGSWNFNEGYTTLKLQAQRTAGTGNIGGVVISAWGQQT